MGPRHPRVQRSGGSGGGARNGRKAVERLLYRQGAFEFLERALALRLRPCLCISLAQDVTKARGAQLELSSALAIGQMFRWIQRFWMRTLWEGLSRKSHMIIGM